PTAALLLQAIQVGHHHDFAGALAQPRVLAMTAYNAAYRQHPIPRARLESLQSGFNAYRTLAALAAVPGDAVATADGDLLTTSSGRLFDQLRYLHAANDYIDRLHRDTPLVAITAQSGSE
ncbi:hypothetical protein AAFH96_37195, partial [Polymorphospora sp. 2-325]